MGYVIHKLDVDEFDDSGTGTMGHLPEHAAVRLEAPVDCSSPAVAAAGSNIVITTYPLHVNAPIFMYDTETSSLAAAPRPSAPLMPGIVVPVGRRLYALNPRREDWLERSLQVMSPAPRDAAYESFRLSGRAERWSWESVPSTPPYDDQGDHMFVTAYAVHPDCRTIFVSPHNRRPDDDPRRKKGTYSFDTAARRPAAWTPLGEWLLPFQGQGHYYVDDLDAWVGLHKDGHLCSCDVASRSTARSSSLASSKLDSKIARETLLREDHERRVGEPANACATLAYMGNSEFCLAECAARRGVNMLDALCAEDGCVLHVTVFGLRYDKAGELRISARRRGRTYLGSRYNHVFTPKVFWM